MQRTQRSLHKERKRTRECCDLLKRTQEPCILLKRTFAQPWFNLVWISVLSVIYFIENCFGFVRRYSNLKFRVLDTIEIPPIPGVRGYYWWTKLSEKCGNISSGFPEWRAHFAKMLPHSCLILLTASSFFLKSCK